jgi:hypothetical protein
VYRRKASESARRSVDATPEGQSHLGAPGRLRAQLRRALGRRRVGTGQVCWLHCRLPGAGPGHAPRRTYSASVTDKIASGGEREGQTALPVTRPRWYQRPTIRTLKARASAQAAELHADRFQRDNEATRLPVTEVVHLGGLVLVEAFTPSTVSALYREVNSWPTGYADGKEKLTETLIRSRRGVQSGWQNIHLHSRSHRFKAMPGGHHDWRLPDDVEAVWLHINYLTPSLTMVVATFTLAEDAGDLSALLRQDHSAKVHNLRVRVFGRYARLREKIPWSRPARHGRSYTGSMVVREKRDACADAMRPHQEACERWFFGRFKGRFATADRKDRPGMRLILTTDQAPFTGKQPWLAPVGLERSFDLWRSSEPSFSGWMLSFDGVSAYDERHVVAVAARRKDAVRGLPGEDAESNWALTQEFGSHQATLAVRCAIVALLELYSNSLSDLRDRAGAKRSLRRPVREARELDQYLLGDGLDAATITADIRALTENLELFRRDVPEYVEDFSSYPANLRKGDEARELLPGMCESLHDQAVRLVRDHAATIGNIRASAELRQAMANTKLQRIVVALSVMATVIAFISLLVATS